MEQAEGTEGRTNYISWLDRTPAPLLLVDENGQVVFANRSCVVQLAIDPLRLVKITLELPDSSEFQAHKGNPLGYTFNIGTTQIHAEINPSPLEGIYILAINPEIARAALLGTFFEAARSLTMSINLSEMLTRSLDEVAKALGVEMCSVWLSNFQGELTCVHAAGPQGENVKGTILQEGQGIAGQAFVNCKPIIIPDAQKHANYFAGVDEKTGITTRSVVAIPLRNHRGDIVGVLQAINTKANFFNETHFANAVSLAQILGYAIGHIRMNQETVAAMKQYKGFAGSFAHDVNNIIGRITLAADALQVANYDELPQPIRQIIEIMQKNAMILAQILKDTLALAQARNIEEIDRTPLSIKDLIDTILTNLQEEIGTHKAEIILNLNNCPPILGVSTSVQRALTNLISNAVKYGGKPEEHISPIVIISYQAINGFIQINVKDNGPGLTTEEQSRLFQEVPQHQRPVQREGVPSHGIGLASVRHIVEALGGRVGVESTKGQGSTFWIALPIAPE